MSKRRAFDKWLQRIEVIGQEYPFGPLREIKNIEGRLHCDDGPAYISPTRCIDYQDGRKHGLDITIWGSTTYFYEGIMVPKRYVTNPESISFESVMSVSNQEVRYAGIRLYGFDRMLKEGKFKLIDEDEETGNLLLEQEGIFSEPIRVVSVFNSTAEPNGEYKRYFLSVPPGTQTAMAGVAWTFRKEPHEYAPAQET